MIKVKEKRRRYSLQEKFAVLLLLLFFLLAQMVYYCLIKTFKTEHFYEEDGNVVKEITISFS